MHKMVVWVGCLLGVACVGHGEVLAPPLEEPPVQEKKVDPLIDKAWHLDRTRAKETWKITKGDPKVTLAFVDSGIEYNHPDLAPNLKRFLAEWPPNGKDKDGNGFPDDVIGWDFVENSYLPFDRAGHGTFLAGLAAAAEGNGYGSAGMCPKCTLLTARFLNADGFGDTKDAIKSIEYAISRKVSVINLAFSDEGHDRELLKAIEHAGREDIVVVAAASNDGLDLDKHEIYPAKYKLPHLLTVAATGKTDLLWEGSNWGKKSVQLAAPGADVLGPWKAGPGGYDTGSGTSDAAAVLTGAVGLIRSANPKLHAPEVVEIILHTVRHVEKLDGKLVSAGVLDVLAAVQCAVDALHPCLRPPSAP